MLRKYSLQQIDLSGDLQDFCFISPIEPETSSFYISLGLSIFESLLRLKSCPMLTHSTWCSLFTVISKTKSKAESWLLLDKHQEFLRIVQVLNNNERKHAVKFLKTVSNNSNSLMAIDYTMRFITQLAVKTDIEFILNNQFHDYLKVCKNLPLILNIGIGIGRGNQLKVFVPNDNSQVPMIFLYIIRKGQFGLLYHRACKYIDEKSELNYTDCAVFPFVTKSQNQKTAKKPEEILELVEILAQNLKKNLNFQVKKKILDQVQSMKNEYPGLSHIPAFVELESGESLTKNSEFEKTIKNYSPELPMKLQLNKTSLSRNKTFTRCKKNKKNHSVEYYSKLCRNNMELYKMCKYCKKVINCSDFSLIFCETHTICIQCRTKFYVQGKYVCPECERGYSIREHNLLRVNDTSKKIIKLMPKF